MLPLFLHYKVVHYIIATQKGNDKTRQWLFSPIRKINPLQKTQGKTQPGVNARDAMSGGGLLTIETDLALLDEACAAQYPDVEPGL
jgi:hypothetical protein